MAWTPEHRAWLLDPKFPESAGQVSLRTKIDIICDLARRFADLEREVEREVRTRHG